MTFGELKAKIAAWQREPVEDPILSDAANDAIQNLFNSVILANLNLFWEGPVQNLVLASGSERGTIVSIMDPTDTVATGPVAGNPLAGARVLRVRYTLVTESGSETMPSPEYVDNLDGTHLGCYVVQDCKNAYGWNVYANGVKQNDAPLLSGDSWVEPENGISTKGQNPPIYNKTADDICFIRHLEVETPNGTWRSLTQADIDSALMSTMSGSKASSSAYQSYAWDFVNQRTIEIRPAAGTDLNPRYFYLKRPRRMKYDGADIPFTTFDPENFLKYWALSLVKLSLDEYDASAAWAQKAEVERLSTMKLVGWNNFNKDLTIQPYLR